MQEVLRPRRSNWCLAASPRSSQPTRLATMPSSPSRLVMYAKLAGAPPSWRPSGKISQSNSPRPTVVNFFMEDPRYPGKPVRSRDASEHPIASPPTPYDPNCYRQIECSFQTVSESTLPLPRSEYNSIPSLPGEG